MIRSAAGVAASWLDGFARRDLYPTRTVETAFAWFLIAWSWAVVERGDMLVGPQFAPLIAIMPETAWGMVGLSIGMLRIVALLGNGHWRPSPEFRFVGALWGTMFWIALAYCYFEAVKAGAPDFPMRRGLYVLIVFELFSCYRCGQDMAARTLRATVSTRRGSADAGYG